MQQAEELAGELAKAGGRVGARAQQAGEQEGASAFRRMGGRIFARQEDR